MSNSDSASLHFCIDSSWYGFRGPKLQQVCGTVRVADCGMAVSSAYTCKTRGEIDAIYYIVSFLRRTLSMLCSNTISGHMKIAEGPGTWTGGSTISGGQRARVGWKAQDMSWYTPIHWHEAIFDLYTSTWVYTAVDTVNGDGVESSLDQFCSVCPSRPDFMKQGSDHDVWLGSLLVCLLAFVERRLGWGKLQMSMLFDEPSSSPKCVQNVWTNNQTLATWHCPRFFSYESHPHLPVDVASRIPRFSACGISCSFRTRS